MPASGRKNIYSHDQVLRMIRNGGIEHSRVKDYLIDRNAGMLFAKFRNVLSYEEFEDLFMDALSLIAEKVGSSDVSIIKPEKYLQRIFKNITLKYLDRKRKETELRTNIREVEKNEHLTDNSINKDRYEMIIRLLEEMPKQCKNLILMKYYEGRSHQEIAGILGITVESSKVGLSRCKKELLKRITEP